MDSHTIDVLSTLDPTSMIPRVTTHAVGYYSRESPLYDHTRDRFLSTYGRPDFGWYIAQQFANHGRSFPMTMMGRDVWVFTAYRMITDPWKNYNQNVAEAYHLARFVRDTPDLGSKLKAMLMSFDHDHTPAFFIAEVARRTGVSAQTIEAFEVLFYNVLDRRQDGLYLSEEVYPQTRAVELDEDYLKNSSHADILKRVAYNHQNMDMTAYLAGIGDHSYMSKMAASDDREAELTKFIMGNGLLLTHTNLLNQRSVGLGRVSTLLAASRQGGNTVEEPAMGGIQPLFNDAYRIAASATQEGMLDQLRRDEGALLDV